MSLEFMSENHLCHIMKHSIAVVVTLGHSLVVDVTMLVQEAVGGSIEVEQNLLDISNSSMSCILLTGQQCLLSEQQ